MENGEAKQVLLDAANYIEQHGWTRGGYVKRGRVCVMQAIGKVAEGSGKAALASFWLLEAYLGLTPGQNTLGSWNDWQRSRKAVLKALRAAGS